jgi:hypothetical protein
LVRVIRAALPRTCALIGEAALHDAFRCFLDRDPPRTRFFREIPLAFAASTLPRWEQASDLPSASADLLRYEAALWEVADLPSELGFVPREFSFERPAAFDPALRLVQLAHAVHGARAADGSYERGTFRLCIHRELATGKLRTYRLNAVTYALLERLLLGHNSVAECVQQLAAERGARIDARYVDGLCEALSQFIELGIVLGSR